MKLKLNEIMTGVSRKAHIAGLKVKKHSPEILIAAGVVGVVTSAVMACKATTKVNEILEKAKEDIDDVHAYIETADFNENYDEEDGKKALATVYVRTGVEVAKLYAPSVILGTLSLTAIISSHNILRKRNVALAAAYAGIEKSFKDYRGRVIERFGKELDRELRYDIKSQQIEEKVVNEDGSETVVTKTVSTVDPNNIDATSVVWYEGNPGWTKSPEANLIYLKGQQAYANEKLKHQGFLFLNDVYEQLGFPKTSMGQVIGWLYDPENPIGDNYVDFGIWDIHDENKIRFVNGLEQSILLEFNHDGNILDKI